MRVLLPWPRPTWPPPGGGGTNRGCWVWWKTRAPLCAQVGPGGVRSIALGGDGDGVAAPDVDAHQARAVIAAGVLEEHDHPSIGGPGRALRMIPRIEQALTRAI